MKNWRTTLVGAGMAAAMVVLEMIQHGSVDLKTIATAAGIALIGYLSKDFNVSGTGK